MVKVQMAQQSSATSTEAFDSIRRHWRLAVGCILLFAVLYAVVPQLGSFRHVWIAIRHAEPWKLGLAGAGLIASYLAAAGVYKALTFRKLRFGPTVLVQVAVSGVGRLLPAGLGGLGIGYLYLRKQGCSSAEAGSVVAINNLLGSIGHVLLLLVVGLVAPSDFRQLQLLHIGGWWWIGVGVGGAAMAVIYILRRRLNKFYKNLRAQLGHYRRQPLRLLLGLGISIALTACNVTILWLCASALGIHLTFVTSLLALTAGVALGTATPTPGGLGGAEAGIAAALVALQIPFSEALGVALLYRLYTYWIPLVIGGAAMAASLHYAYV